MTTILTILGARPQFVKAAAVSRAFAAFSDFAETLVHTGQHHDANMSDIFFEELEISRPQYNLGIRGGSHGGMTGRMLIALEDVIQLEQPDLVLVYGDTNSTLAGALAASKLHVPIAHVEAGLRSFNRRMPEEVNRVLTDHAADWLLSPTDTATGNLLREGIIPERIHQVGDVMYDAALFYGAKAEDRSNILAAHGLRHGSYVLATIHRQENTDFATRLRNLFLGLQTVARKIPVVVPLHPRTHQRLADMGGVALTDGLIVLPPVGYLDMIMLERAAAVIATDSGGVQKEAFFFRVPCVTLRAETEWVELVDAAWNRLAPPSSALAVSDAILNAIGSRGSLITPYGAGNAAQRVAQSLVSSRP